jgi:DNA-binding NarL/FixJ family response regulator
MQSEIIGSAELKKVRDLLDGMMLAAIDTKNEVDRLVKKHQTNKIEQAILKGHSVRQIAKNLNMPSSTIHDHIKRLSK